MSVFLSGFLCLVFLPRDPFTINSALKTHTTEFRASQVGLVLKNLPANAGDVRDIGLIPGSGRSPGGGHGSPHQYSCLENPMDRGTVGYSPWGFKEFDVIELLDQASRICFNLCPRVTFS